MGIEERTVTYLRIRSAMTGPPSSAVATRGRSLPGRRFVWPPAWRWRLRGSAGSSVAPDRFTATGGPELIPRDEAFDLDLTVSGGDDPVQIVVGFR
jgi:hypothetical protein